MRRRAFWIVLISATVTALLLVSCAQPSVPEEGAPAPGEEEEELPEEEEPEAAPAAPEEETFEWKMVTSGTRGSILHHQHDWIAETLAKTSGGRLNIEMYAAGELFPVTETLPSTASGVVQMAATYAGYWGGLDPAFTSGSTLPGPLPDYDEVSINMELVRPVLEELYAREGVHVAGLIAQPPECYLSNVEITEVEDFQGVKTRNGGLQATLMEELGCTVVFLSAPEMYSAFQLGTIDAGELTGFAGDWDMSLQEVVKYIIEPTPHVQCGWTEIIVDQEAWDELPPEFQGQIEAVVWANSARAYMESKWQDMEARQKFIDYGVEVLTMPDEEWDKVERAAFKVWDDWAEEYSDNEFVQVEIEASKTVARMFGHLED
jgi:TRAP-type mannitol/chloroaromatic compound transport system substrate-binding protein